MTYPPLPEPLPAPVVDNHCHVDIVRGDDELDIADGLAKAASVGVTRIVQIGCDLPGARFAEEASRQWDNVIGGAAAVVALVAGHPGATRGGFRTLGWRLRSSRAQPGSAP